MIVEIEKQKQYQLIKLIHIMRIMYVSKLFYLCVWYSPSRVTQTFTNHTMKSCIYVNVKIYCIRELMDKTIQFIQQSNI